MARTRAEMHVTFTGFLPHRYGARRPRYARGFAASAGGVDSMKENMLFRYAVCLVVVLSGLALHAEDWPEFRGPTGQGHSSERGLPLEWSDTKNVV